MHDSNCNDCDQLFKLIQKMKNDCLINLTIEAEYNV